MWFLCIAFAATQLLAVRAQASSTTSRSSITTITSTTTAASRSFDCFGDDIPLPSVPPFPSLAATIDVCDVFGPSPVPSAAAALSSWEKLYTSWYGKNGPAMTSYFLSIERYQSSASTLTQCTSLYAIPSESVFEIATGSTFATDYFFSGPNSYYYSSCSASLASAQASSNIATLTTSISSRSYGSAGSRTSVGITTITSTSFSSSSTPATSGPNSSITSSITSPVSAASSVSSSPASSPTSGSNRFTTLSAMSPYAVMLSMIAFVNTMISTAWHI